MFAGLLAGLAGGMVMTTAMLLLAVLRVATPLVIIGDRLSVFIPPGPFLSIMGKVGGYNHLKQLGVGSTIAGQLLVAAIGGAIFGMIARRNPVRTLAAWTISIFVVLPLVVLVPGTIWETKHWTVEGFAGVARHFLREGFAVALAGTKRDQLRCREIAAAAPGTCDLSERTTPADLAALIRRAEVAVTNDSGSMHLAASVGTPMVSVFGPTNPVHIGPYERPESVVRVDLPCSPCNYRRLSQCPFDHACMKQVTSAMVVERVEKILASKK